MNKNKNKITKGTLSETIASAIICEIVQMVISGEEKNRTLATRKVLQEHNCGTVDLPGESCFVDYAGQVLDAFNNNGYHVYCKSRLSGSETAIRRAYRRMTGKDMIIVSELPESHEVDDEIPGQIHVEDLCPLEAGDSEDFPLDVDDVPFAEPFDVWQSDAWSFIANADNRVSIADRMITMTIDAFERIFKGGYSK